MNDNERLVLAAIIRKYGDDGQMITLTKRELIVEDGDFYVFENFINSEVHLVYSPHPTHCDYEVEAVGEDEVVDVRR